MSKLTIYKGIALSINQHSRQFYLTAMPAKDAIKYLGYMSLKWDETKGEFEGFNREIKDNHVAEMVKYIKSEDSILPNSVIVYFLHKNLAFNVNTAISKSNGPEIGEFIIKAEKIDDEKPIGFVIDGQHRLEALKKLSKESDEEDLSIPIVAFHAPSDTSEKAEFDSFILRQMDKINRALQLTDNEKLTVQQILGRVDETDLIKSRQRTTANLIVKQLDRSSTSGVNFKSGSKKPPKKTTWLDLSVWVNIIQDVIVNQYCISKIFQDYRYDEHADRRKRAIRALEIYFRAIKGLINDKGLWESSTKDQRLYHNVGLSALLGLFDYANDRAGFLSVVEPGKIKTQSDEEAIKRVQKALKPICLLDWTIGNPGGKKIAELAMAGIQKQKKIPGNFKKSLRDLIAASKEIQADSNPDANKTFVFSVFDSMGIEVCRQEIILSKKNLDLMDKEIDDGSFQ